MFYFELIYVSLQRDSVSSKFIFSSLMCQNIISLNSRLIGYHIGRYIIQLLDAKLAQECVEKINQLQETNEKSANNRYNYVCVLAMTS